MSPDYYRDALDLMAKRLDRDGYPAAAERVREAVTDLPTKEN